MKQTPESAFQSVFGKNKNFMTPKVVRYGEGRNYYFELSKGTGIGGELIYGVTVVTRTYHPEQCHELSKMFTNKNDAEKHIKTL